MTDFGRHTLPLGVFRHGSSAPRVGAALDDQVIDLSAVFPDRADVFSAGSLNAFLALGRPVWQETRARLLELAASPPAGLIPQSEVTMELPFEVADYVDFYASEHHASNLGRLFRPDSEPLLPNWKRLPVGYHGRSGTIVADGTGIVRPAGQRRGDPDPVFGPSQRLDIEVELGYVVGAPSTLGTPVPVGDFAEHVFGVVLVNDWSARDIQAWEYVPLGPFLGKSFATSISTWVVPLDALTAVPLDPQDPPVLPYLSAPDLPNYDITFEVSWNGEVVSRPPYATTYWSPAQMLAHLTVNGANVRTGDLFASGTVSGPAPDQRGSFIELAWNGRDPLTVAGQSRTFLEDGDTVTITATTPTPHGPAPLGTLTATIHPTP